MQKSYRAISAFAISLIAVITVIIILVIYYLFTPQITNLSYDMEGYKYRIINIYELSGTARYAVYCYLANVDKMKDSHIFNFVYLLESHYVLDTFFYMQYSHKLGDSIFSKPTNYNLYLMNKNITDDNEWTKDSRPVFVNREEENKLCINFSGKSHVLPDSCYVSK
jgi:hypothetical protein